MTRPLRLVTAATCVLIVGGILVRVADPFGLPAPAPAAVVPSLVALAALLVVALVADWAPTLAWVTIVAGSVSASVSVTAVTDVALDRHATPLPVIQAVLVASLLVPPVVAGAYAALGPRRPAVLATAWLVVVVLTIELTYRAIVRIGGAEVGGGLPRWAWLALVAGLTALGLVRDLAPVLRRTRERLASERNGRQVARAGRSPGDAGIAGALPALRVLLDELVPGRDVGRAEAIESERGRLAADLHAQVLPSLHRALAEAEAGGSVERLAADLRSAVDDVESLLVARRSIVLEEMGLLAGLEWLAERIEDRSDTRVEIEVAGAVAGRARAGELAAGTADEGSDDEATDDAARAGDALRPPREVERAAFRIAQLALDNVLRHVPGHRATVTVGIAPSAVAMRIEDDGTAPMLDEVAAARNGRRGVADMRAAAAACGGSLVIDRASGGSGVAVDFRWPA